MSKNPFQLWYKEGLRFKCTGCGACCTGGPGYVWLEEADIEGLANRFNLNRETFLGRYTKFVSGRYSLLETSPDYDCIFLKERRCTVYEDRPRQCRKFPWWKENLKSREDWLEAAKSCEGINHPDAPLISADAITEELE